MSTTPQCPVQGIGAIAVGIACTSTTSSERKESLLLFKVLGPSLVQCSHPSSSTGNCGRTDFATKSITPRVRITAATRGRRIGPAPPATCRIISTTLQQEIQEKAKTKQIIIILFQQSS